MEGSSSVGITSGSHASPSWTRDGRTMSPIISGRTPRGDGPPFLMSGHRRCRDRVIRTRISRVHGPRLGVYRGTGRDRSISSPLARRGRESRRDGEARQMWAIPGTRSVRLLAWLGRAAFGPARLAGGGTQTTPFSFQRVSLPLGILSGPRQCFVGSSAVRFFGFRYRPDNTSRKNDRHDPSLHCKPSGLPK
jgi:hypothetical protein